MHDFSEPQATATWDSLAQNLIFRRPWLIGLTVFVSVCVAGVLVGTQTPMYRATAMVLIEDTVSQHPLLEQLQIPNGSSEAATAIALLTTRKVAEEVVRGMSDGSVPASHKSEFERHLGLTTQVEDESLLPLHEWSDRLSGTSRGKLRVFAQIDERASDAPDTIRFRFLDKRRVELSVPSGFKGSAWFDDNREVLSWSSLEPIEYMGLTFWLNPEGELDDRSFLLRSVSRGMAAENLLSRLKASETGKNTGVVRIIIDDSDPQRAADIVNAVARNYLDLSLGRSRELASNALELVDRELESRKHELSGVEREVERLQTLYPEAMDVGVSSTTLLQHKYSFDGERLRVSVKRKVYEEALGLLESGQYDAFARLGESLTDSVTRGYLGEISELYGELGRTYRGDMGTRHQVLQERMAVMGDRAAELDLRIEALRDVIRTMETGDTEVLARFFTRPEPGTRKLLADGQTATLMASIADMRAELVNLEAKFTSDHHDVRFLKVTIPVLEKEVYDHLLIRLDGLVMQRSDLQPLVDERAAELSSFPTMEREQIETSLANLRQVATRSLKHRLESLRSEEEALNDFGDSLDRDLHSLPKKELQLAEPLRKRTSLRETVAFLMQKRSESVLSLAGTVPVADLIDKAFKPQGRLSPRVLFSLVVGAAFGLLLGLALAALRERFNRGLQSQEQLEVATGLPVLASIPRINARTAQFGTGQNPAAEACRVLRSKFQITRDRMQSIMVTSCAPGEGRSMTNIGLASAFALAGYRVLLVDADLHQPTLHNAFGLPLGAGLAEVLEGRSQWRECALETSYRNLDLLSAGHYHTSPGDLLSSVQLDRTLAELKESYDMIVFDAQEACHQPDVTALAGKLDAVLFLYKEGTGPRQDLVAETIRDLRRSGANLTGAIYNGVRRARLPRSTRSTRRNQAA